MNEQTGKMLVGIGVLMILAGLLIWFFSDKLQWIGRLPGDIRSEGEHVKFYMPITTMILFSILASAVWWIIRKFF